MIGSLFLDGWTVIDGWGVAVICGELSLRRDGMAFLVGPWKRVIMTGTDRRSTRWNIGQLNDSPCGMSGIGAIAVLADYGTQCGNCPGGLPACCHGAVGNAYRVPEAPREPVREVRGWRVFRRENGPWSVAAGLRRKKVMPAANGVALAKRCEIDCLCRDLCTFDRQHPHTHK